MSTCTHVINYERNMYVPSLLPLNGIVSLFLCFQNEILLFLEGDRIYYKLKKKRNSTKPINAKPRYIYIAPIFKIVKPSRYCQKRRNFIAPTIYMVFMRISVPKMLQRYRIPYLNHQRIPKKRGSSEGQYKIKIIFCC